MTSRCSNLQSEFEFGAQRETPTETPTQSRPRSELASSKTPTSGGAPIGGPQSGFRCLDTHFAEQHSSLACLLARAYLRLLAQQFELAPTQRLETRLDAGPTQSAHVVNRQGAENGRNGGA
jgi:hypothetical protein